eukprot:m.502291 g.502291  ORF g.502291 m.502291 type:complete len:326 (-) comp21842_c1_seq41:891-1868(-)
MDPHKRHGGCVAAGARGEVPYRTFALGDGRVGPGAHTAIGDASDGAVLRRQHHRHLRVHLAAHGRHHHRPACNTHAPLHHHPHGHETKACEAPHTANTARACSGKSCCCLPQRQTQLSSAKACALSHGERVRREVLMVASLGTAAQGPQQFHTASSAGHATQATMLPTATGEVVCCRGVVRVTATQRKPHGGILCVPSVVSSNHPSVALTIDPQNNRNKSGTRKKQPRFPCSHIAMQCRVSTLSSLVCQTKVWSNSFEFLGRCRYIYSPDPHLFHSMPQDLNWSPFILHPARVRTYLLQILHQQSPVPTRTSIYSHHACSSLKPG